MIILNLFLTFFLSAEAQNTDCIKLALDLESSVSDQVTYLYSDENVLVLRSSDNTILTFTNSGHSRSTPSSLECKPGSSPFNYEGYLSHIVGMSDLGEIYLSPPNPKHFKAIDKSRAMIEACLKSNFNEVKTAAQNARKKLNRIIRENSEFYPKGKEHSLQ